MSLLAPLINIIGMSRYDLPAIDIKVNIITNWLRIKNKLNLSNDETINLIKLIKNKLYINAFEEKSKSTINFKFSKNIDNKAFNDLLRDFINEFKICKKCKCPEVVNNKCEACGYINILFNNNESNAITKEQNKLSKQEKKLNKIKLQQSKNISSQIPIDQEQETLTMISKSDNPDSATTPENYSNDIIPLEKIIFERQISGSHVIEK